MDDLNKIAPNLLKVKKENPFKTPSNYFDDFNTRLQDKMGQEPKPNKKGRIIKFLKPAAAVAASIAIILMLVFRPLDNSTKIVSSGNEISYEIDHEFIGLMEEMDVNSLLTLFSDDETEEQFSEEGLIFYLSDNLSGYDIYLASAE